MSFSIQIRRRISLRNQTSTFTIFTILAVFCFLFVFFFFFFFFFLLEETLSPRGERRGSKLLVPMLENDFYNTLFRVAVFFFFSKLVGTHFGSILYTRKEMDSVAYL